MTVKRAARSAAVEVPVMVDVEINSSLDPTAAYITLAHELGHIYCGHLGSQDPDLWPNRQTLDDNSEECEAEAVAYIAGLRLDPDVRMPPHLAGYLEPPTSNEVVGVVAPCETTPVIGGRPVVVV